MENVEVVHRIYEAFGRGDVPAILEHLSEEVEWDYGSTSAEIPWLQPLHGRAQVPRFFEALQALEFRRFEPHTFLASGDTVVVLLDLEAVVRATGAEIREEDEAHIWHFRDGAVVRFRHRADTLQHLRAYRHSGGAAPPHA